MHIRLNRRHRHALITGTLLAALLWRALIPSGYMLAADGAHALEICPEGMPDMMMGGNAGHPHGSDHIEHCPFGAAPSAAPLPSAVVVAMSAGDLALSPAWRFESVRRADRGARAHQPRAPPVA